MKFMVLFMSCDTVIININVTVNKLNRMVLPTLKMDPALI